MELNYIINNLYFNLIIEALTGTLKEQNMNNLRLSSFATIVAFSHLKSLYLNNSSYICIKCNPE